jgi:hypothetical protein
MHPQAGEYLQNCVKAILVRNCEFRKNLRAEFAIITAINEVVNEIATERECAEFVQQKFHVLAEISGFSHGEKTLMIQRIHALETLRRLRSPQ